MAAEKPRKVHRDYDTEAQVAASGTGSVNSPVESRSRRSAVFKKHIVSLGLNADARMTRVAFWVLEARVSIQCLLIVPDIQEQCWRCKDCMSRIIMRIRRIFTTP